MPELIDIEGPTQRRRRRRRNLLVYGIVAAMLILAGAILAGAWWYVAHQLNAEIDAFADRLGSEGGHLTASSRSFAGFPFRPAVVFARPDIAFPPGAPGPWSWSGERAEVAVSLFAPDAIDVSVTGSGRLRLAPLGNALDLATQASTATVRLAHDRARENALARIDNLAITIPSGETVAIDTATLSLARATGTVSDERSEAYGMHLELAGLTLPADRTTPLGRRLDSLTLDAHVLGPLAASLDTKAFAAWRTEGGTAELTRLEARFGPLAIFANATLTLDQDMQPMGAGTGRIQGFAPALDALAASQAIKLNDAKAAKAFLSLLARPPAPGEAPELRVPLTIQEGKFFVGPVALMQMPRIDWPDAKPAPTSLSPAPSNPGPDNAAPKPPVNEEDIDAPKAAPAPKVERLSDPK